MRQGKLNIFHEKGMKITFCSLYPFILVYWEEIISCNKTSVDNEVVGLNLMTDNHYNNVSNNYILFSLSVLEGI